MTNRTKSCLLIVAVIVWVIATALGAYGLLAVMRMQHINQLACILALWLYMYGVYAITGEIAGHILEWVDKRK